MIIVVDLDIVDYVFSTLDCIGSLKLKIVKLASKLTKIILLYSKQCGIYQIIAISINQ